MIKKIWQHLSKRRRKQFWLLLVLMIMASIMEVVSISAVVPFLGALTSPEQVYQHHLAQPLIQILEITEPRQLLLPLTIIFVVATLIASIIRLLLLYASTRLSYAAGADLSINIYRRTLYQNYLTHTSHNSSEIINSIITKTNTVTGSILVPLLNLISSVVVMLGIISVVFTINAQVAVITFSIFALLYWVISFFTKKSLQRNSQLIATQSTQMIKSLQEGLGGIRDVLIDGTQEFYCKLYQKADLSLRRASGDNIFISSSPRYLMEAIGMILIAILAYTLTLQKGGVAVAIPVLGALAIGAQKLLPALQQAYNSYSSIKGANSSFIDVLNLLNQPLSHDVSQALIKLMPFEKEIVFKDVSFRYTKDTPWILKNVNLNFKKGTTIGFIGETGSGKSTLLDILMGLLSPISGELLIDGIAITEENRRSWQAHISHVPQSIYLADSTIQENIAFGVKSEKIKEHRVSQAAQQAQISETIHNLKNKYKTFIGERGVKLSGGQKQRIGIARALYKDSDVLIFDEATSALDNQTEHKIMQQIEQLNGNRTIFIIAHRLTTLKQCDSIIRINTNHTIKQVNYNQIIN
jgi:ATP-binding cassette, subfamily B, bacterial PglK